MLANAFPRAASAPSLSLGHEESGPLLGWELDGLGPDPVEGAPRFVAPSYHLRPVTYNGDSHLLSCASTGMGKGRGAVIPNALTYPGPFFAIDIKGELYQVTARRRREMGQQVVVLDPFHLVTTRSDSLNPFDLLQLPRADFDSDAEMLASVLATDHEILTDPYWKITANGLIAALIAHIASFSPNDRHLGQLRAWLFHHDMDMAIATILDKNVVRSRMARELLIAYLAAPVERTRPCTRTMACTYVSAFGSNQVVETLRSSSFRLQDVYDGRPLSIYIVIPPEKLESHKALLRLWIATLLTAIVRRTTIPRQRTLFLLDECAQLGSLPILRQAITLLRGSGLQIWTIWQDLSQLRQCYPDDWQTILNNAGVLQVFGLTNHHMAKEWSELLGEDPQVLDRLARENAVVRRQGQGALVCRRPDYLQDQVFEGLFDANPRFALRG